MHDTSVVPDLSPNIAQAAWTKPFARIGAGPYPPGPRSRCTHVHGAWLQDLESLEAISQDDDAKRIFLRMAAMSQAGQMTSFLSELEKDNDLDETTKGTLEELARDDTFLLVIEDYVQKTQLLH